MVNSVIQELKIELGEISLKEIILKHFFPDEKDMDKYEQYFYLNEEGNPIFVVEQKS